VGRRRRSQIQFGDRVKAFFFFLLVCTCVWVYNGPFENWSKMHPSVFHNCDLMSPDCGSGLAEWVPNGYSHPTYAKCACTAVLQVGGHSK
jgi:hypothetical protein